MNRQYLESFLGKRVEIKLFDGDLIKGELHKTREEKYKHDNNLYLPKNYYFLENPHSTLFRSSHVKKIRLLEG